MASSDQNWKVIKLCSIAIVTYFNFINLCLSATVDLAVQDYLQQVRSENRELVSLVKKMNASLLQSKEGDLLFSPQLTSSIRLSSDARPQFIDFLPNRTDQSNFFLGLEQQFPFGPLVRFGYEVSRIQLKASNPTLFNTLDFYDSSPSLELNFPLLRNSFSSEFRSQRESTEARFLATYYEDAYQLRIKLLEAELAYWRLSVARETLAIRASDLARSEKNKDWINQRLKQKFQSSGDLLQASADYQLRKLEFESAAQSHQMALQEFNRLRERDAHEPSGNLESIASFVNKQLLTYQPTQQTFSKREDLLASEQTKRFKQAQAQIKIETNRPNLELFGQLQLNGRAASLSESLSASTSLEQRSMVIGLRLISTLNFGLKDQARQGAVQESEAAHLALQRSYYEQEQEFSNLHEKIGSTQSRLSLIRILEKLQLEKLAHEKKMQKKGRTTLFQILQFESDYSRSQLERLTLEFEMLTWIKQLETISSSARFHRSSE